MKLPPLENIPHSPVESDPTNHTCEGPLVAYTAMQEGYAHVVCETCGAHTSVPQRLLSFSGKAPIGQRMRAVMNEHDGCDCENDGTGCRDLWFALQPLVRELEGL